MRKVLITMLLIAPFMAIAQVTITGKIITAKGNAPLVAANIFLNNSSFGTASADDGSLSLYNVGNGQYDLIVSSVGYESRHVEVSVNDDNIILPDIQLAQKINVLKEVKINLDPNREEHLRWFIQEFLGTSANSKQCKILNTDLIDLSFSRRTGVLKASTDDFLIIENKALGYTIKYLLDEFSLSGNKSNLFYAGSALFEAMHGTPQQENKWQDKRLEAYNGSPMHFLRASLHNRLATEQFIVSTLTGKKVAEEQLLRQTDQKGIFAFTYPGNLYIGYANKKNRSSSIFFIEKYAFFDLNGVIISPRSVTFQNYWGNLRMAELLPVDYQPPSSLSKLPD